MMTRKHFNLIAKAIADAADIAESREEGRILKQVARNLADGLETTNPAFNRDRFLDACHV